eukprot:gene1651-3194_t
MVSGPKQSLFSGRVMQLILILISMLVLPILTFLSGRNQRNIRSMAPRRMESFVSQKSGSGSTDRTVGFDSDFAEAVSKPLPEWYLADQKRREELTKEIEANRQRIVDEFKKKYEVTAADKAKEINTRWDRIEANGDKKASSGNWFSKAFGLETKEKEKTTPLTTKEAWEKIWNDDEKEPDFYLPGFFEVFPELKFKWPKFSRTKDGNRIKCEMDSDCPFPQACCPHPIIPGDKFCCTGWGSRVLVPQYCPQEIMAEKGPRGDKNAY